MNEKIRQLARESNLDVYGLGKDRYKWESTVEKFAEMIVKECAESLWTEECYTSDLALKEFEKHSKKIKLHFGIEL
jgi:hypothetical protein